MCQLLLYRLLSFIVKLTGSSVIAMHERYSRPILVAIYHYSSLCVKSSKMTPSSQSGLRADHDGWRQGIDHIAITPAHLPHRGEDSGEYNPASAPRLGTIEHPGHQEQVHIRYPAPHKLNSSPRVAFAIPAHGIWADSRPATPSLISDDGSSDENGSEDEPDESSFQLVHLPGVGLRLQGMDVHAPAPELVSDPMLMLTEVLISDPSRYKLTTSTKVEKRISTTGSGAVGWTSTTMTTPLILPDW
jgi:hypothetical protein